MSQSPPPPTPRARAHTHTHTSTRCAGGTLEEHLRRFGRPSAERVDAICLALIAGLSALHSAHIAARNIGLDRVLLTAEGDAKLAYYGAAARLPRMAESGPEAGARCLDKASERDKHADREALARMMVQLAAGRTVWADTGHLPGLSAPTIEFINNALDSEYVSHTGASLL
jgi:serine/threonine protein kinase